MCVCGVLSDRLLPSRSPTLQHQRPSPCVRRGPKAAPPPLVRRSFASDAWPPPLHSRTAKSTYGKNSFAGLFRVLLVHGGHVMLLA